MAAKLAELLERWDSPEGHPYKGSLIDWSAYTANPDSLGCMCAQGQALHFLAGWSPEKLKDTEQAEADRETAKLLNISLGHAILLRVVNDSVDGAPSIVLIDPAKVIGDQADKILDFWHYLDGMSDAARAAAWDAAWGAARAAARDAAAYAVGEIMGARILREQGREFFFLPMFGFASPEEIPARPADYGKID